METAPKLTRGIWYWNEISKTLEFASSSPPKAKKTKVTRFQESKGKDGESRTELRTKSPGRTFIARKWGKHSHELVTLDDVKNVGLGLLEAGERKRMEIFSAAVTPERLDDFLMALLLCVSCYLERIALETKPRPLMKNISLTEIKAINDVLTRLETAEKYFAHMYCRLILAVGIPEKHQMACKRSNASAPYNDWRFLERLQNFSICVSWIAFRQTDLNLIQEEVSSLLHSDSLNPAMKMKAGTEEQQSKTSFVKKKPNRGQKRISGNKRFATNDTICQRSPGLICLMPLPKDKADYLFHQHPPNPRSTYGTAGSCNWIDLEPAVFPTRVGIIGEPRNQFDPWTLAPLPEENDEIESTAKKAGAFDSQGIEAVCHTDQRDSLSHTDQRDSLSHTDQRDSLADQTASHTSTLLSKDPTTTDSIPVIEMR